MHGGGVKQSRQVARVAKTQKVLGVGSSMDAYLPPPAHGHPIERYSSIPYFCDSQILHDFIITWARDSISNYSCAARQHISYQILYL